MALFTAVGLGLSLAGAGFKAFQGAKQQKQADRMLENFKHQKLNNAYEHQQLSTLGADRALELAQAGVASANYNLARGGSRALLSGAMNNNQKIFSDNFHKTIQSYEEMQNKLNFSASAQDMKNQDTIEARNMDHLNYARGLKQAGRDELMGGLADGAKSIMGAGMFADSLIAQEQGGTFLTNNKGGNNVVNTNANANANANVGTGNQLAAQQAMNQIMASFGAGNFFNFE